MKHGLSLLAASVTTALLGTTPARANEASIRHAPAAAALTIHPLGFVDVWFEDPNCSWSPDSMEVWVIYGDENGEAYRVDAGHTSYMCTDYYVSETFSSSPSWSECNSYWGGQCPSI